MASPKQKSGFTLIEVIVTLFIMIVISVISLPLLFGANRLSDLRNATREIVASLSEAQQQSADDSQATTWGVRLSNPTNTPAFFALFRGTSYASGTVTDYHRLPATVAYVTSTLALGSTTDIIFSVVSGAASQSTTVRLYSTAQKSYSSTITVASSGMVGYVSQ
jgi:type II secretory pathway pseudopilin PulG